MFVVGSGSVGTTTTGADISTIIPTKDYSTILSERLRKSIVMPNVSLPLFLIDSEGMGVRGDEFDFMTTSPPAIIAKDIVWIGSENLETSKVFFLSILFAIIICHIGRSKKRFSMKYKAT